MKDLVVSVCTVRRFTTQYILTESTDMPRDFFWSNGVRLPAHPERSGTIVRKCCLASCVASFILRPDMLKTVVEKSIVSFTEFFFSSMIPLWLTIRKARIIHFMGL